MKELEPLLAKGAKPGRQWELFVQGGPGFFRGLTFIQAKFNAPAQLPQDSLGTITYRRPDHAIRLPPGMPAHLNFVHFGEKKISGEPGAYQVDYVRDPVQGDVKHTSSIPNLWNPNKFR
jgi:hypothetical protein